MSGSRRALRLIAVIAGAAVLVRALLPLWITDALNEHMAEMGAYRGQVADVDLALYRGAYRIDALRIEKRSGKVPVPLIEVPTLDLSIRWRELFSGALVGEAEFHAPQLNFVDGREPDEDQAGRGVDWRQRLESLLPVRLDRIVIHDGVIAFRNPFVQPGVDLRMRDVEASVTNLTNIHDAQGKRDANLSARARVLERAPLQLTARFDPLGSLRDFALRLRVTDIELTRINDLTRAYAAIDIASGHGSVVLEMEATGGHLQGYAKPLLDDLEILDWEQDVERDADNPLRLLWEGLGGAISALFRNQPRDRFATRIPIEGDIGDPDVDTVDAVVGVLRNAFVRAYDAHFEDDSLFSD